MDRPVLEYGKPDQDAARPRPVGMRTLVAGCVLSVTAGVSGVCLAAWGTQDASDVGRVIMACGGAAALVLALTAACESLLFPRNVSDPRRAIQAAAANLLLGILLIVGTIYLPWTR